MPQPPHSLSTVLQRSSTTLAGTQIPTSNHYGTLQPTAILARRWSQQAAQSAVAQLLPLHCCYCLRICAGYCYGCCERRASHSNSAHRAMWSEAYSGQGRAVGPISASFSMRQRAVGRSARLPVNQMWSMIRLLSPLDLNFQVLNSTPAVSPSWGSSQLLYAMVDAPSTLTLRAPLLLPLLLYKPLPFPLPISPMLGRTGRTSQMLTKPAG
mmetsp:Transcript_35548/g.78890  ORF Transcript_35548/g.78890 Transcript_35548/m.78890 type:complete len:211 (-) Transcript_35548:1069-1701(-)